MELIITEKPQAAMRIAYALADIAPVKKTIKGVSYYEVIHNDKKLIVACAVGHLFGLTQKVKTSKWPVFDLEWQPAYLKKGATYTKRYVDLLKSLIPKVDSFTIACDYDIEGELIGWNVLRFICQQQDARRMTFSTLTKDEIAAAYAKVSKHIDWGLAYAGETRHYLDWLYGINLSRALMSAIKTAGAFKILSIGRVQGPALALVVEREKKISSFRPQPYWQVKLLVSNSSELEVSWPKNIFDKAELKAFAQLKGKEGQASTEVGKQQLPPPFPFDLTTLQLEAYRLYSLTPSQVLQLTQQLYLAGLISYPRTSSQKLPATIGYKRILNKLGKRFKEVSLAVRAKPIEGKKSDPAHPAIYPTGEQPGELSKEQLAIYDLIVRRFIACFSADALLENKVIKVKIDGKTFSTKGSKILEKGWLAVYKAKIAEKILPDLKGKILVKDVLEEEKETQPPKHYTAASLVAELARRNLGTKGTRALIIDTLYSRGYIGGTKIFATQLGMIIEEALSKNCPLILDEQLTRKFEQAMDAIQTSKKEKKEQEKILLEAKAVLKKIALQFKEKELVIGKELLKAYAKAREEERRANILTDCPVCGKGKLVIIRSKRTGQFVACNAYPKCKTTFSLPKYGLIKKTDKVCQCGFPILVLIRKGRRPWEFCFNPECKEKEK